MPKYDQTKSFLNNLAASGFYDGLKAALQWGVPVIVPTLLLLEERLRHLDKDWWAIGGMFCVGAASSVFGYRSRNKTLPEVKPTEHVSLQAQPTPSLAVIAQPPCPCAGLFTPLQIDAFRLAKELGELLATVQPREVVPPTDDPYTPERTVERMLANVEHEDKFRPLAAQYALELAPRVKELMYRFEKEKINANGLIHFTQNIASDTQIPILRSRLIALAFLAEGVKVGQERINET